MEKGQLWLPIRHLAPSIRITGASQMVQWFKTKQNKKSLQIYRRHGFDPWVGQDALEEEMATHSSILAWEIPWTEEPGGLEWSSEWHGSAFLSGGTWMPKAVYGKEEVYDYWQLRKNSCESRKTQLSIFILLFYLSVPHLSDWIMTSAELAYLWF